MLFVLREHHKKQRLGDSDCELLQRIDGNFGVQSRRETAMAMLLWQLRKEYEQRCCTLLSHAATEDEMHEGERDYIKKIIDRIDGALAMDGA